MNESKKNMFIASDTPLLNQILKVGKLSKIADL
jgi:hypothetical protein